MVVLVGVWAAVLLPPALRSRRNGRPSDSIGSFHRHLSVLSRTAPSGRSSRAAARARAPRQVAFAGPLVPRSRLSTVQRRRRDVFVALCAFALVSTAAAVLLRGTFVYVALLALVALGGYVAMLLRIKRLAAERSYHRSALVGDAAPGVGRLTSRSRAAASPAEDAWDGWPDERDLGVRDLDDWDDWDLVDAR